MIPVFAENLSKFESIFGREKTTSYDFLSCVSVFREFVVIGFLSLPIRLLGNVLMTAFLIKAMAPLRSLDINLTTLETNPESGIIAASAAPANDGSALLTLGLAAVAVISIWLIYQTYRQHIALAEGELRNRRAG